jgi:HlyD family secretion protein
MSVLKQWPALLALLIAGWVGIKFIFPLFQPQAAEMDVQTSAVQRGDLRSVVPADGVIVPAVLVEVKSKAAGVVEKILVEPGQQVKAGDILVELDKKQLLADLRQAEADLAARKAQFELTRRSLSPQQKASNESAIRQAELNLTRAEENYATQKAAHDRIAELHSKGYATQSELDNAANSLSNAQNALELARESLQQTRTRVELDNKGAEPETVEVSRASIIGAEARVENLREDLGYTTVRSPIDGTVLSRPVELGTAVSSGTQGSTGGTVVATVGDLSTLYVKSQIEETDIAKVKEGTKCRISFDAHAGWVWEGRVSKIYPYPEGQTTSNFGTNAARYPVDIAIKLDSGRPDSDMARGRRGGGGRGGGGGARMGAAAGGGAAARPPGGMPGGGRSGAQGGGDGEGRERPAPPELLPRMTATAEIVLEDHPDVLWIPNQFIKYDKGKPYVEVIVGGQEALDALQEAGSSAAPARSSQRLNDRPEAKLPRERREIETGYTDGVRTAITSGLEESDIIYLERPIRQNPR